MKRSFTLMEMIIVIILLGITSTIGVGLLKIVFDGYINSKSLFQIFYEAKFGAERIGRELREAIPNSIVIESDNSTLSFAKFSSGGYYYRAYPSSNKIGLDSSATLNVGDYISIHNRMPNGVYNDKSCDPSDNTSTMYRIDNTTDNITLCKDPVADSPMSKFYKFEEVVTFRLNGNKIERCSSIDFKSHPVSSNCLTLFNYVKSARFVYTPDIYGINDQVVDIYLEMSKYGSDLVYKHKVHIRNTP
ncbi:PulJ/GspJ family protein [Calditerrivibrio nitroreducens]|uniref:Type II secretion system protein n=1 Tax=Calditerrivibrio nitroreducens TaxID=477976 RepID=A0A2J6WGZ3_9BACT|nr:MAG: hypothetical protein C0187_06640 [Calditerrivibrio nitroreducens]